MLREVAELRDVEVHLAIWKGRVEDLSLQVCEHGYGDGRLAELVTAERQVEHLSLKVESLRTFLANLPTAYGSW